MKWRAVTETERLHAPQLGRAFQRQGYRRGGAHLGRLEIAANCERSQQDHLQPSGPPGARPDAEAGNGQRHGFLAPAQAQPLPAVLQFRRFSSRYWSKEHQACILWTIDLSRPL